MDSRIIAPPLVEGDAVLIASLHSKRLIVLLNSDGRAISSFTLENDFAVAADPVFAANKLLIPTDKGLICATSTDNSATVNPSAS